MKNFFRKDLNLSDKWWHRILVVLFFVIFAAVLVIKIVNYQARYEDKGLLVNRMNSSLKPLRELVKENEKIDVYENNVQDDSSYEHNGGFLLRQPNYFCSKNIINHIEELSEKTGVYVYKGNGGQELISLEKFKNYLLSNNAYCVDIFYLEPKNTDVIAWAWEVDNDIRIWQESKIKSIGFFLLGILGIIVIFTIVAILYYKAFLYIIFGKKK